MGTPTSNEDLHEKFNQNYEVDTKIGSNEDLETERVIIDKAVSNSQRNPKTIVSIPDDSSMDDVKMKVLENLEKDEDGHSKCKLCGKVMMGRTNMKKHIETHLEGLSFSCETCGKQSRSSDSLRKHKSIYHR